MKSSPFKLFSLSAREADQRGNYANPELGRYKATTFDHPDLSGIKSKKGSIDIPEIGDTDITLDPYVHKFKSSPKTGYDQNENRTVRGQKTLFSSFKDGGAEAKKWIADNPDLYKQMLKDKSKNQQRTNTFDANDQKISSTEWKDVIKSVNSSNKAVGQMKGSPVKHNAGAVGSIAGANPLAGGIAGIGKQISNQAQQRAADAGGSTSVDPFLPPPNQVAETGSYGGGGDRILEMDSNPVGNQSIGRDTDVASQLFGSGQRASMLAMKGTPLHTEGHGGAKGHTHAKPGDYLDQTVAEDMGVNDIEDYEPIQKFKGKQMVVNLKKKDTIFSTNSTFVIPKHMEGITRSTEGTPSPKPVYINRNKKQ